MTSSKSTQVKGRLLSGLSIVILIAIANPGAAHAAANPQVSNQASSSGFPVGSQVYDSAMLGGGTNPTGSLTFKLFGPTDVNCAGAPVFTTNTAVNGNGYYESSRYVAPVAGTYRWIADYSGDANNNGTDATDCSDPEGQVSIARKVPALNASPAWASPSATSTAVLTSGAGPSGPTGSLSFAVFGPNDMTCANPPAFVYNRSVSGNSTYPSAAFKPTVAGTYQWVVNYSGDANNVARSTVCSDTSNGFTASPATPAIVTGTPSIVSRGGTMTVTWSSIASPTSGDWMAIYAAGTPDGGAVKAWKYTGGGASGTTTLKFPWGATAGTYEIRLLADNNIQRLATSAPITVVG